MFIDKTQTNKINFVPDNKNNHENETSATYTVHAL